MPRLVLYAGILLTALILCSCAGSRVDIVDTALDSTLYPADTKAERLLRYFEVQALLVRFAAEAGAGTADRNAMALANVAATAQLNALTECLQVGSINMSQNDLTVNQPRYFKSRSINDPRYLSVSVRGIDAYCSFFESRLISYQDALFAMLRQVASDDATAQVLNTALTGPNVLNFGIFVSTLVQAASSIYRDERILRAFTADALELEYLISESSVSSPDQLYTICPDGVQCDDSTLLYPERTKTNLEDLRRRISLSTDRPNIMVWHFQEVYAFMIAACRSLNGDVPAVANVSKTRCSAGTWFPFPLVSSGSVPRPGPQQPSPAPVPPSGGGQAKNPPGPASTCPPAPQLSFPAGPLTDLEFAQNCKRIADLRTDLISNFASKTKCERDHEGQEIDALRSRNLPKVCS